MKPLLYLAFLLTACGGSAFEAGKPGDADAGRKDPDVASPVVDAADAGHDVTRVEVEDAMPSADAIPERSGDSAPACPLIHVISATLGQNCTSNYATLTDVADQCEGLTSCTYILQPLGYDPAPNCLKYATILYSCGSYVWITEAEAVPGTVFALWCECP